jgi:hypothetical protein
MQEDYTLPLTRRKQRALAVDTAKMRNDLVNRYGTEVNAMMMMM